MPTPPSVVRGFIAEVLNAKNLDALNHLVAENFVEQVPFPGQGPGRAGLRSVLSAFIAAFPDMRWTIDEQIVENEKVVTRFTFEGTHRGEFLGIPASNNRVKTWGVVIDVVRNGVMSESRIIIDMTTMMEQIRRAILK